MKKNLPVIIVFSFFIALGWACGIGDAFVSDDIESIENPRDRAWAWKMEWFYQEHGRHPNDAERDSLWREFEAGWPDSSKTAGPEPATQKSRRKKKTKPDTVHTDTGFVPPVPPAKFVPIPDDTSGEE